MNGALVLGTAALAALCVAACGQSGSVSGKEPVVFRADFTSGTLEGWVRRGGAADLVTEDGRKVLRIVSPGKTGGAAIHAKLPPDKIQNKRVHIHCRYRLTDLAGEGARASFALINTDAETNRKSWPGGPILPARGTGKWTDCRIPVDLPEKLKDATLRVGINRGKGTLLIDSIRLTVGPKTLPPVTDEVIAESKPGQSSWTLAAPGAGRWQLDARCAWGRDAVAARLKFDIASPAGKTAAALDQQKGMQPVRFDPLTVLDLKKGQDVKVTLADGAKVAATVDAVRLVRLPEGCAGTALLYENTFSAPQRERSAEARRDWVMEGGGIAEWEDGLLRLRPRRFTIERSRSETDHLVYWLKKDFPADLAIEWEFRFPDLKRSPKGLVILFICAQGLNGEDLFDPKLAKREGVFKRYYDGDINCYHISYFAGARGRANVRKNKGFYLVTAADDLVVQGGAERFHRLRLTRFGQDLTLSVNGQRCITWTDDGQTYGPIPGGGKLGLRQQNNLLQGDYTNLRVYALKKP